MFRPYLKSGLRPRIFPSKKILLGIPSSGYFPIASLVEHSRLLLTCDGHHQGSPLFAKFAGGNYEFQESTPFVLFGGYFIASNDWFRIIHSEKEPVGACAGVPARRYRSTHRRRNRPTTAGYTEEAKDQPDAQQFDGCVTTKWGGRRKLLNSSSLHVLGFGCAERMRSRPWLLYSQRGCGTGESFSKAYCCFGGLRLV